MLLEVKNLQTHFKLEEGVARAVDGVSFSIKKGETFAVVGESGCGKSVTALSVMGLLGPAAYHPGGSVLFNGKELLNQPEATLRNVRGNQVAMIFQEPMTSLNPVLTVGYQLLEPLKHHFGTGEEEGRAKIIEALKQVQIPDPERRFEEYPHQLSGGMKQRVMIAMAMVCEPDLLIADEPTTALDVTIQAQILELINLLQKKKQTAVFMITHDLGVVSQVADRIAVMYAGKIVETAPAKDLLHKPAHPYTVKLLNSLPAGYKPGQPLQTISGRVPAASRYPTGCRFEPRCHVAMEACKKGEIPFKSVGNQHQAACLLYKTKSQATAVRRKIQKAEKGKAAIKNKVKNENFIELKDFKVYFPIRRGLFKKTVGHVRAVDGVSLQIKRGSTLALVGESGCGKSTLARGLLRLEPVFGGQALIDGEDIAGLGRGELQPLRKKMQIIFQDPFSSLNPRMTVGQIIREGAKLHNRGSDANQVVGDVLEKVGLDRDMMYRYPHEFSGGQRQRIGIARALAVNPDFIICDEATSALDVSVQAQILNLLKRLQRDLGLTYLFITHDLSVVRYLADEVAVMYLGRIIERAKTSEIFSKPKHPYTRALLSAVPEVFATRAKKFEPLSGDIPSPSAAPSGCHFHPRCPVAMAECSQAYPPAKITRDHEVSCFLYK